MDAECLNWSRMFELELSPQIRTLPAHRQCVVSILQGGGYATLIKLRFPVIFNVLNRSVPEELIDSAHFSFQTAHAVFQVVHALVHVFI